MKKTINKIKLLAVLSPVIVILCIYIANINYSLTKSLLAGTVTILCSLEFYLLDELYKKIEDK